MSSNFSLPENVKVVELTPPAVGAGAVITSDYISLKNAHKAWLVVHYADGNGNAVVLQPMKATAVAPTGATAITNVVKIWSNLATATNDTLVERTAATSYTLDGVAANKLVIFEIDPVDLGDTYDVIGFTATTPQAAEYISAVAYLQPRYAGPVAQSLTALTD